MKKPAIGFVLLMAGPLWLASAQAHHSYAMFDSTKIVTSSGVIAKFEWTNPHTFVWFYAPKEGGGYQLVGLEGGGPAELTRSGWTRETFKVGEKVTIQYKPLRDGRPGGAFVQATHADGTVTLGESMPGQGPPAHGPSDQGPPDQRPSGQPQAAPRQGGAP